MNPFADTWMNTLCEGAHENVAGSVIDSAFTVAALTVTGTPSTTTTFPPTVGAKLFPTTVNVPPGRSGDGSTETISGADGFGVSVTLIVACATCWSIAAEIDADPTATALTRPVEFTVAISGAEDDHTIAGFGITLPLLSRTVAMSCVEPPGTLTVAVSRESVTMPAIGFFTRICATPLADPDAARTVPRPACSPVTSPDGVTLTTVGVSDDQTGARSVIVSPCASSRMAVACVAEPTTSCGAVTLTFTLLTGVPAPGPSAS